MKVKLIFVLSVIGLLIFSLSVSAGELIKNRLMSVESISNGNTNYSTSVRTKRRGVDYSGGLLISFTNFTSSTAVNITQQCSLDNTNFYTPVNRTGSSVGLMGNGVATSSYLQVTPIPAEYTRFAVTASGDTIVTLDFLSVED